MWDMLRDCGTGVDSICPHVLQVRGKRRGNAIGVDSETPLERGLSVYVPRGWGREVPRVVSQILEVPRLEFQLEELRPVSFSQEQGRTFVFYYNSITKGVLPFRLNYTQWPISGNPASQAMSIKLKYFCLTHWRA